LEPDSSPPQNIDHAAKRGNGGDLAAHNSEVEMFEGNQRRPAMLCSARDQSALGKRRIVNSMRPPESSRQDSISVM
jgi:hypothetical protein